MKNKIIGFLIITLISIGNIVNAETMIESVVEATATATATATTTDKNIEAKDSSFKQEQVKTVTNVVENKNDWKKSVIILFYIVCLFTGGGIVFI